MKYNQMQLIRVCIIATSVILGALAESSRTVVHADSDSAGTELSFGQDVRPIISNHCFACHGPDEQHREADTRLDVADEVDLEEMLARITSTDPDTMMPPPELNKPLTPEQIATLSRWIDQGAPHEQHWAFSPPQAHGLPQVKLASWSDQSIDRFVLANLEDQGMQPSPKADKRALIRRVTLDLTGLPPTLQQIDAFLEDNSDQAFENLVDRLIGSPGYGEQMARYWLDLVRFADTNGLHHDHYREMTPYRDWVIRSFADNLPMDDFITYQLAGDLFEQPTIDQQIASGFNRLHLIIDRGTALPEESFFRNIVDQVSAVGTAFMGLTMQCAVCHDHKYDPITQKDFYQLSAFFNNFDGEPETGGRGSLEFKRGLQPPYINLPTAEQEQELGRLDAEVAQLASQIKELRAKQEAAEAEQTKTASTESGEQSNEQQETGLADQLKAVTDNLNKQQKARDNLLRAIPATLVMRERSDVRPAHIMIRGAYDQPGEEVGRDVPSFLPPMKNQDGLKTRMDLAQWLVDPSNPLTGRVAVNRIWQQFFGVGLVKTPEDFGAQGESPSHPELLDYLANRFVESGWDVKALVRSIVLSQTYQQSSKAAPDQYVADPDNRLLARGSRFRLDAEVIRDQMLAVSGLLNTTMYGKSVKPPQPDGLWKIVAMPSSYPNVFEADTGESIYRRSVYTFWKRGLPPPQMTIFDAPTRESCIARRERTNTPLQALLLMNEQQHFAGALHYAKTLIEQSKLTDKQKIAVAYESITSREPDDQTIGRLQTAKREFQSLYAGDPAAAEEMIATSNAPGIATISDPRQQIELASWTMLVHSLLNLDITKTRE
jgi:cytochrome c553